MSGWRGHADGHRAAEAREIHAVQLLRDLVTAGSYSSKFQWNLPYLRGCRGRSMSRERRKSSQGEHFKKMYLYIFGLWNFPNQGLNLYSLNWKGRVLTTGLPGKSLPGFSVPRPLAWIPLGKGRRNACLNAHSQDSQEPLCVGVNHH